MRMRMLSRKKKKAKDVTVPHGSYHIVKTTEGHQHLLTPTHAMEVGLVPQGYSVYGSSRMMSKAAVRRLLKSPVLGVKKVRTGFVGSNPRLCTYEAMNMRDELRIGCKT